MVRFSQDYRTVLKHDSKRHNFLKLEATESCRQVADFFLKEIKFKKSCRFNFHGVIRILRVV